MSPIEEIIDVLFKNQTCPLCREFSEDGGECKRCEIKSTEHGTDYSVTEYESSEDYQEFIDEFDKS